MKKALSKLKTFAVKNWTVLLPLFLIILLGACFRLYKLENYLTFLGDEGRDVLVVKRIIVDRKFTLLGPITSVGSMYMGPIYYYFMVPFLWLFRFDPVGPAVMVVLFSLATMILSYRLVAEFFSKKAGLITAYLYAISPLSVLYGRSSWNPNIVPFFSLLCIYSLLKMIIKNEHKWFLMVGFSLGILFQLHYVTFMFVFIVPVVLALLKYRLRLKYFLGAVGALLMSYSPFLMFELRHKFINTQAVWRFLWQQKSESALTVFKIFQGTMDVFVRLFWRLVIIENAEITKIAMIVIFAALIWFFRRKKSSSAQKKALKVILIWFFAGTISFGLYSGVIYDYYFGSLWLAPFILTSFVLTLAYNRFRFGKMLFLLSLIFLTVFSLKASPLRILPSNLMQNTKEIARFVYEKTEGKPYNFALLAGQNSDHAYRYFLEVWEHPPKVIENPVADPERTTVTEQLLVVCEEKVCQPLGHSLWEIAGFGRAEIVSETDVVTAKVFHLIHYEE